MKLPIKWLAPETITTFTFSLKTDVFSFGVLVYEIFADGAEPWDGQTNAEVKAAVGFQLRPDLTMCIMASHRQSSRCSGDRRKVCNLPSGHAGACEKVLRRESVCQESSGKSDYVRSAYPNAGGSTIFCP